MGSIEQMSKSQRITKVIAVFQTSAVLCCWGGKNQKPKEGSLYFIDFVLMMVPPSFFFPTEYHWMSVYVDERPYFDQIKSSMKQ